MLVRLIIAIVTSKYFEALWPLQITRDIDLVVEQLRVVQSINII